MLTAYCALGSCCFGVLPSSLLCSFIAILSRWQLSSLFRFPHFSFRSPGWFCRVKTPHPFNSLNAIVFPQAFSFSAVDTRFQIPPSVPAIPYDFLCPGPHAPSGSWTASARWERSQKFLFSPRFLRPFFHAGQGPFSRRLPLPQHAPPPFFFATTFPLFMNGISAQSATIPPQLSRLQWPLRDESILFPR